jgi:hypothetical protein
MEPKGRHMDHVERYLEVYESLRRRKRWGTDPNILRFAALTLAASEVDPERVDLEAAAKALVDEAGGFSPLNSPIRHAVAAILIRRGMDSAATVRRIKETLALFKEAKLQKGGTNPYLAALLLVLDAEGEAPSPRTVQRMKAILDRWKDDHWWLTGSGDYPMAAMHAARDSSVEQIALEAEVVYQAARRHRFSRGNQLQLASHLLLFSDAGPREAAERFARMADALRSAGQRIGESQYDEVALLVLSRVGAEVAAARAVAVRDHLRAVKPKPPAAIAFSIACGVVLAETVRGLEELDDAGAAANLRAVQSVVEAQQAAMIACIAATTAATTAATSS